MTPDEKFQDPVIAARQAIGPLGIEALREQDRPQGSVGKKNPEEHRNGTPRRQKLRQGIERDGNPEEPSGARGVRGVLIPQQPEPAAAVEMPQGGARNARLDDADAAAGAHPGQQSMRRRILQGAGGAQQGDPLVPPRGRLGLPVSEVGREQKGGAVAQGGDERARPGAEADRRQGPRSRQRQEVAHEMETESKPVKTGNGEAREFEIAAHDGGTDVSIYLANG